MLVIEVDGNSHDNKYNYDIKKQGKLEKLGLKFIRFDNLEVKNNMFNVLLELQHKIEKIEKTL